MEVYICSSFSIQCYQYLDQTTADSDFQYHALSFDYETSCMRGWEFSNFAIAIGCRFEFSSANISSHDKKRNSFPLSDSAHPAATSSVGASNLAGHVWPHHELTFGWLSEGCKKTSLKKSVRPKTTELKFKPHYSISCVDALDIIAWLDHMLITVWSVLDQGASLFLSCELLAAGNGLKAASDAGDLSFLSGSNQAIWATLTIHRHFMQFLGWVKTSNELVWSDEHSFTSHVQCSWAWFWIHSHVGMES